MKHLWNLGRAGPAGLVSICPNVHKPKPPPAAAGVSELRAQSSGSEGDLERGKQYGGRDIGI